MSRKLEEMTPDEKKLYKVYESILNNDLATAEEKVTARKKLDELSWTGAAGPLLKRLASVEKRLDAIDTLRDDLILQIQDAIQTTVQSEAKEAAQTAVAELLGESKPTEVKRGKTTTKRS